jgi:hypothetical protein
MSACTHKELSEIKFDPIAELDGVDHEAKLARLASVARIAIGLLGKSKEDLIEFIQHLTTTKAKEALPSLC